MKSQRLAWCPAVLVLVAAVLSVLAGTVQAADANLRMVFTTTNAGGSYGNSHVHVVWIKDASGNFVYTAGSTTTDNKRAVWANSRAYALTEWYNSNTANRSADIAARTGATQTSYQTYARDWNWRKLDGTVVPDGTYQIHFLCTNSDSGSPNNKFTRTITKGSSSWTVGPVSEGGYNNVTLTFTPASLGVTATAATNVKSSSATLNGAVDATEGVNPNVTIYWGPTNGGTTPTAWANQVSLGTLGVGAFSTNVINLNPVTTYYYRCRAVTTSPAKDVWSTATISFVTPNPDYADIDITPASMDFQQVPVNGYLDANLTVKNLGKLALTINSLKFVGLENEVYSLVPSPALPLVINAVVPAGAANWLNRDIGSVGSAGSFTATASTITVKGSGADIWGEEDEFQFVYQSMTGDGQIIARVDSLQQDVNEWSKAGVMMRNTLNNDSKNVYMAMTPIHGPTFQWRTSTEGSTSSIYPFTYTVPYWVRLVRSGSTFSGYYSANGTTWTQNGVNQTISMNSTIYVGLAVTSHTDGTLCTAVFSNISGNIQMPTPEVIDQEVLKVRFSPKSVQDYKYAKLAIGSNDPGKLAYVDLQGVGGPDAALGVRPVGGIGGKAKALAKYGDKVLMGQGAMLVLLDVSNPAAPSKLNQIRLDGVIEAISVNGDAAYAALGNKGFAVVNLKDFKPLLGTSTIETGGFASDIDNDGTNLCIADGIAGTHVYNIASPLNPAFVKTYATTGAAMALDISGGLLYVLDESKGVQVFQFSSSTALKSYALEFGTQIVVNGTTIYVVDSFGHFFILDAAGSIALQSELILQIGSANAIQIQNGYAYITGENGIEAVNISNPANPISSSVDSDAGTPKDILLDNTAAYVADASSGLNVFDANSLPAFSSLGVYSLMAASGPVSSPDTLENVYTMGNGQSLTNYDLSVLAEPAAKDTYGILDQAEDVAVAGSYAYVAAGSSGLKVFDLSNPASAPGTFATAGFASAVSVNGSRAMVSDGANVYVLDVSSPMTPTLVGSWQADGHVFDVAAGTTHGYVAKGGMGITILNLTTVLPTGSYTTSGVAYGVAIDQNTLYVAAGSEGLVILNVSSPAAPALVTNYDLPGVIVDLAKVGDRLCVADALSGVSVVDVSNPAVPTMYANSAANAPAFHISSAGSRILAADKQGGLAMLGVTDWPKDFLGEISGDSQINLDDLIVLAGQWLQNETGLSVLAANLDYYDTQVNLKDLSVMASVWQQVQLPPNLEGYWKFDETTGSVASDSALKGRNGSLTNMSGTNWVAGKTGNALSFDGTDDYVVISNYTGIGGTGARTVSLWVKTTTTGRSQALVQWGSDTVGQLWLVRVLTTNVVQVAAAGGGVNSTTTVTDGQWHHIAAVLDAGQTDSSQIRLYIDGVLNAVPTGASTISTTQTVPVHLGAWNLYSTGTRTSYLQGSLDDVRIYSRALTSTEIVQLAQ